MLRPSHIIFMFFIFLSVNTFSQEQSLPAIIKTSKFDGTIKTKLEICPDSSVMRFNVRNARIGVRGDIGERLSYRVQVDLSNEGAFSPLDMYATLKPTKNFSFLFGQQNIPFDNNYIITPAELMFANRAFLGKYFSPGTRDIGAVAQYRFHIGGFPMEGQAGMFNGGKINAPQWTDKPSFALRLIAGSMDGFRSTAKIFKYNNEQNNLFLWAADLHYANDRLRLETEVMNRHSNTTDSDLFGTYIQGSYTFALQNAMMFHCITPALRWDAMGYDVWNNNFDVKRITAGIQFGLTFIPYDSLIRIDYEQYFKRNGIDFPDFANRDKYVADNKVTLELVVKF